jgi:hypothetical protein
VKPSEPTPRSKPGQNSALRVRVGAALQRSRSYIGATQAEVAAEHADLSPKYVGQVERGDVNLTLDVWNVSALQWVGIQPRLQEPSKNPYQKRSAFAP